MVVPDNAAAETSGADLLPFIPVSARRVLDYRCGDGRRGHAVKQRNHAEVIGLAHHPAEAEAAAALLDRAICLDAEMPPFPLAGGYFDCVLCADILAQVRDAKPHLAEILRVLCPGGLLIVTIPNVQYHAIVAMLAHGDWPYENEGTPAWNQMRYYTGREITRLLRENGFNVLKCGALLSDPPQVLPRSGEGMIAMGRVTIGPLNDDEYKAFLTRQYIVFANKPAAAD